MQVKPGWQTTEFWQSAISTFIGLFVASGVHIANSDHVVNAITTISGAVIAILSTVTYTFQRSQLKQSASTSTETPIATQTNTTADQT